MLEASVTINGHCLARSQIITVRIILESWISRAVLEEKLLAGQMTGEERITHAAGIHDAKSVLQMLFDEPQNP